MARALFVLLLGAVVTSPAALANPPAPNPAKAMGQAIYGPSFLDPTAALKGPAFAPLPTTDPLLKSPASTPNQLGGAGAAWRFNMTLPPASGHCIQGYCWR